MSYGIEQIQTLEGIDAIRKRPGMYIGSIGIDGLHHINLEIISNAIDEYLEGTCNRIVISVSKDDVVNIKDNGRGVPFGKKPDGTETLENIFTKLHTGAKFSSDGSTGYNSSGGMNGVGSKATNALSEFFNVISVRDGKKAIMRFEKGHRKMFVVDTETQEPTGTTIEYKADNTIFKEGITLEKDRLVKQLKEFSFLCPGLVIELNYKNDDPIIFQTKDGMIDYIKSLCPEEKRLTSIFSTKSVEDRYCVSLALCYSSNYSETAKLYTNNIPNSSGTHLTGFRAAMTRTVNDVAREMKLLKDKDGNLTGDDLKEGLVLALSLKMPDPIFNGQTKDVLTSAEGRTIVEKLVGKEIRKWFTQNPSELKTIVNKAVTSKKAREAAKKARDVIREKNKSVLPSAFKGKLVDCISKDPDETELFLVEGESAGGGAKQGRDRQTQAVLPLQGKVLNSEKTDITKLLANKEIKSLIRAIGAGFGNDFDINKVRYKKIIIMADADVDGSHIRVLLMTFFFKYMRPLIEHGYVYLAMAPLYKVEKGTKIEYLLDDSQLAEYKRTHQGQKYEVTYMKGLGEMDKMELKETTMNIENRRLKQMTLDDADKMARIFNKLMGSSVAPRKEFIEQNAHRANVDI
jgi:DNA gyrase subunit B